ncbi:guanylate kinase [Gorillibacterium timonense]|uniref:guanylate kinase n=1 Tax=Gorillibacterium timonense TaxID=1689269 RepID=UPI00071CA004|nr:guanylate kinase [Gorillibacterium timonense]
MKHNLLVFQGPSASGKNTLQARLGIPRVITWTSRRPRPHEAHGVDYHFSTRAEMEIGMERGQFLEMTDYNGQLYGTSLESIKRIMTSGERRSIILDVHGARKLKELYPDQVLRIGIRTGIEDCRRRLLARGSEEDAVKRLATYGEEAEALTECDLIIANSDATKSTAEAIIDYLRKGLME